MERPAGASVGGQNMEVDYRIIGRRIRDRRDACGMTQAALAEMSEMSVSHVSCIERGKRQVSLAAFIRIVNALETTADGLLWGHLINDKAGLTANVAELMAGCSEGEKQLLLAVLLALKDTLREARLDELFITGKG